MTGYISKGMPEVKTRLIIIFTNDNKVEDTRNKILKKIFFEGKSVLRKTLSVVMTLRLTPYSYKQAMEYW